MVTIIACIIAFFFALNIGASGAAASMGIAYGSGAVKLKKLALILCGIGVFLGAVIGGSEVVETLGKEIIPESIVSIKIALIILCSASISLFIANLSGIPLSTSEVTVGAIVGVGIAFNQLFINKLVIILLCWILVPIIGFLLAYLSSKIVFVLERKLSFLTNSKWKRIIGTCVIIIGFLEAFSAGMNNVANSVGPLIAANIINVNQGTIIGGLFVAIGAIFLGGNVLETNGKRITELSLIQGGTVSGIGATLVIIASIFGMPVPHTQVTTSSILGVGLAKKGKHFWRQSIITKLIKTWVLSPVFSLVISYNLIKLFIDFDFSGIAILIIFISIVYLIGLVQPNKKQISLYQKKYSTVEKMGGNVND